MEVIKESPFKAAFIFIAIFFVTYIALFYFSNPLFTSPTGFAGELGSNYFLDNFNDAGSIAVINNATVSNGTIAGNGALADFYSVPINPPFPITSLRVDWSGTPGKVFVNVSLDGGENWCTLSNGQTLSESTCTSQFPATSFKYGVVLIQQGSLDSIRFEWANAADTQSPTVPRNLSAVAQAATQVNLSWSPSTDNVSVTGYKIYKNAFFFVNTAATNFSDSTVSPSTTYSYNVSAIDAAGNESAQSTTSTVTTPQQNSGGFCMQTRDCQKFSCKSVVCSNNTCVYSNHPTGTECTDGIYCNGQETCKAGICETSSRPIVCQSDGISCTTETCDEAINSCIAVPDNSLCDDQLSCSEDLCSATQGCVNDTSKCTQCRIASIQWGQQTAQKGQSVTMNALTANCSDSEKVLLELWESDAGNGSAQVNTVSLGLININSNNGYANWATVWIKDTGDPVQHPNKSDPEYLVKATLFSDVSRSIFSPTTLLVTNPDEDNDGTPDELDCNDESSSIGQCSGCAVCSDSEGYSGQCVGGTCPNIICPTPVCGGGTCSDTEIPVYTSQENNCSVNGNAGTCTGQQCSYQCVQNENCVVTIDTDQDGVFNGRDLCPNTANAQQVNTYGCPLPVASNFSSSLTTDFVNANLLDITDLSVGITSKASIVFLGQTNLSKFNAAANRHEPVNLDSSIAIETNRASVNPIELPMLDKAARIKLFNLTFLHPIVLVDTRTCTDCLIQSYQSGTLEFTTTGFSSYSAAEAYCGDQWCMSEISETCSTCSVDCGTCPAPSVCGDQVCNGPETCSSCLGDCGACQNTGGPGGPGGNPGGGTTFCPVPIGARPCPAAVWRSTPICEWDTSNCQLTGQECNDGEKRCFSNYLQECRTFTGQLWENLHECALGCNPDVLECNITLQCIEDWQCTQWSECSNNIQTRLCSDLAHCGNSENKPQESKNCGATPACGDNLCSQGENIENCSADCQTEETAPPFPYEALGLIAIALFLFIALGVGLVYLATTKKDA